MNGKLMDCEQKKSAKQRKGQPGRENEAVNLKTLTQFFFNDGVKFFQFDDNKSVYFAAFPP